MKLTVIIATRNDPALAATLESLGDEQDRTVIVDDASDIPIAIDGRPIVRNEKRLGPARSRHIGANMVTDGVIMFCDSHMVFPQNWRRLCEVAILQPNALWCSVYRSNKIFNSFWHDTHLIGGADFYYWRHNGESFSFCDLLPRRYVPLDDFMPVPCVLGGCYLIDAEYYLDVANMNPLVGYGCEESWMAWSVWLDGGTVNVITGLQVTHLYQDKPKVGRHLVPENELNRLTVLKRILSSSEYSEFIRWLPVPQTILDMAEQVRLPQPKHQKLVHGITEAFGLQSFDEAISLMKEYRATMDDMCGGCFDRRWLYDGRVGFNRCPKCNHDSHWPIKFYRGELLKQKESNE